MEHQHSGSHFLPTAPRFKFTCRIVGIDEGHELAQDHCLGANCSSTAHVSQMDRSGVKNYEHFHTFLCQNWWLKTDNQNRSAQLTGEII
jgi:hypothetical protein